MMKANELMIGDWVNTPHGMGKVKGIHQYELRGQQRNDVIVDTKDGLIEFFLPENIEPIQLSEEVIKSLDENGYCGEIHWWEARRKWIAEVHNYADKCFTMVRYVHELQHALRLCGLNDLADNFKI